MTYLYPDDDCGICGVTLDDKRVFGLCRACAEEKYMWRQIRRLRVLLARMKYADRQR